MIRLLFVLLPILTIFIAIFVTLFTPFGSNKVVKPIANSYIQNRIKKPKVEIIKLDSKYKWVSVDAKSDNGLNMHTEGDIDYFSKKFGLDYNVWAKSVKVDDKEIKVDMNLKGQVVGSVKNLGANGKGEAFGSDVDYKFIVKDNKPQSIVANITSAQIAKIFAILKRPAFVDGYLTVNANIPSLDIKNPKGEAKILVNEGRFNRALISKEFGIELPKDEEYKVDFNSNVKGKYILGAGDLNTTSAKLKIKKITSSLDFKVAKGYYTLYIPNLSRFNKIAKIDLSGKILLDGILYANLNKKIYQIDASTKSFGGVLKLFYTGNRAKAILKKVSIVKVLKSLSQPFYVTSGVIDGVINITNIKHLNGSFSIATNGVLNRKLLRVKLPSYKYRASAKGVLKNGQLSLKDAKILTNFVNLSLNNFIYSIPTKRAKGAFGININNLRALEMFTKIPLNGRLKASGVFDAKEKDIKFKAKTTSFGGDLRVDYRGNSVIGSFSDISLSKLLYTLNQPKYLLSAKATGNFKILNIEKLNGKFNIKSLGAVNIKLIKKLYDIDLGRVFKYSMLIKNGVLKDGLVLTKPKVNTSFGNIRFEYLNYNTKNSTLSGKYLLDIDNLNRLKPVVGQPLNGSFRVKGSIKQSPNQLSVNGVANEFGGVINFIYDKPKLKVDAAGLSVVKLLKVLNYEQVLDGVAKLNLNYNSDSKRGEFKVILDEAKFLNSQLVQTLKEYAHFDLSKELFSRATLNGTINKNIINFNLNTESQRVKIVTNSAIIDTKAQTINARVALSYKKQEYIFRLKGPIKKPHIQFILDGYVKKKVKKRVLKELKKSGLDKEIKKIIPKELKVLKENNETKEQIKKMVPKEIKNIFDKLL